MIFIILYIMLVKPIVWEHKDDEETNTLFIHMSGITENRTSCSVKIKGFTPHIYVEIPPSYYRGMELKKWDSEDTENLMAYLNIIMGRDSPIEYKKCNRKNIYQLKKTKLIKMKMPTIKSIYRLNRVFSNDLYIGEMGRFAKNTFVIHENTIDPVVKFVTERNIQMCDWLEMDDYEEQLNMTNTIFIVSHKNIRPAPQDAIKNFQYSSPKYFAFDIETYSENHNSRLPDSSDDANVIFQISVVTGNIGDASSKTIYLYTLFDPQDIDEKDKKDLGIDCPVFFLRYKTEKDLISAFAKAITREDPDVFIGYNILKFDWEYLIVRAKRHGVFSKFMKTSRVSNTPASQKEIKWSSSAYKDQTYSYLEVPGRLQMDVMLEVERNYKLPKYSLDVVSEKFLKTNKVDITPKQMFKLYDLTNRFLERSKRATTDFLKEVKDYTCESLYDKMCAGPIKFFKTEIMEATFETIHDVLRKAVYHIGVYCVKDTLLTIRLAEKLQMIETMEAMANVCNVPMSYLHTRGQQIRVVSQIFRETFREKIFIPSFREPYEGKYRGAIVQTAIPGDYRDVATLDFASLYPTTQISLNICPSTFVMPEDNVPESECHVIEWEDHIGCIAEGTMITFRDFSLPIEKCHQAFEHNEIMAFDNDRMLRKVVFRKPLKLYKRGEKPCKKIEFDDGTHLICTPDHKIYTPNGWKQADELNVNDIVWALKPTMPIRVDINNKEDVRFQLKMLNECRKYAEKLYETSDIKDFTTLENLLKNPKDKHFLFYIINALLKNLNINRNHRMLEMIIPKNWHSSKDAEKAREKLHKAFVACGISPVSHYFRADTETEIPKYGITFYFLGNEQALLENFDGYNLDVYKYMYYKHVKNLNEDERYSALKPIVVNALATPGAQSRKPSKSRSKEYYKMISERAEKAERDLDLRKNTFFPGAQKRITKILDAGTKPVYDISVDTTHSFVANGVIVHNCGHDTSGEKVDKDKIFCQKRRHMFRKVSYDAHENPVHQGIMPRRLKYLLENRKRVKKDMAMLKFQVAFAEGTASLEDITFAKRMGWSLEKMENSVIELKKVQINILDAKQKALKVSANSFYGAMGTKINKFPTFVQGAETVTAMGRKFISDTISKIETISPDAKTIYGDTDSTMVIFKNCPSLKQVFDMATDLGHKVTHFLKCNILGLHESISIEEARKNIAYKNIPMDLEFESVYSRFLMLSKKRYIAIETNIDGKIISKVDKGNVMARRDSCAYTKEYYDSIKTAILNDETRDDVFYKVYQGIHNLFTFGVEPKKLIIYKGMGTLLDYASKNSRNEVLDTAGNSIRDLQGPGDLRVDWKKNGRTLPPHISLALKMTRRGDIIPPNTRLEYIYMDVGDEKCLQEEKIEDYIFFHENKDIFSWSIDHLYYITHQLQNPITELITVKYPPSEALEFKSPEEDVEWHICHSENSMNVENLNGKTPTKASVILKQKLYRDDVQLKNSCLRLKAHYILKKLNPSHKWKTHYVKRGEKTYKKDGAIIKDLHTYHSNWKNVVKQMKGMRTFWLLNAPLR